MEKDTYGPPSVQPHHSHTSQGVVRTVLDRMNKVITGAGDREVAEDMIRKALKQCVYPAWTVDKIK